jgi:hypothetical protein
MSAGNVGRREPIADLKNWKLAELRALAHDPFGCRRYGHLAGQFERDGEGGDCFGFCLFHFVMTRVSMGK